MSYFEKITASYGDSANLDPFSRLRVSSKRTIFDSKLTVDNQPRFWDDQQVSGSGTTSQYNNNQASVTISVTGSTGKRVRQTFRRFNYQAGNGFVVFMSHILGLADAGSTKRLGLFDDQNGLFLQQTSSGLAVVRRTYVTGSAVDTVTLQSDWNVDKLDGTGTSGITLDTTKTQILVIDFQWLGVGRVRWGFDIDGVIVWCHYSNHANTLDKVYISTPNLPLRYEISNNGAGSNNSMTQICSAVSIESGEEITGAPSSLLRWSQFSTAAGNVYYPLMAIRLKSTHLGAQITLRSVSALCDSTTVFGIVALLNPTVTGTAFSWTALTNSAIEYDVSTTSATTVSGGTTLWSHIESASTSNMITDVFNNPIDISLGSTIAGVSDVFVLAIIVPTNPAETFRAAMSWLEVF